jgi:multiple sugar transport system ATP-binding protein
MTMGTRICVLKDGLLMQVGTPRDLYDRPVNTFVAGFIGSPAMNFIPAHVAHGGVEIAQALVPLERAHLQGAIDKGYTDITFGFRPEDLRITPDGSGLPIEVTFVESLGADAYVFGQIPTGTGDRMSIQLRTDGRRPPKVGETLGATVVQEHAHVFAPDTGDRLN